MGPRRPACPTRPAPGTDARRRIDRACAGKRTVETPSRVRHTTVTCSCQTPTPMTECPAQSRPIPGMIPAGVAGVLGAGAALAATELLAGLVAGAPSVVLEIGALLISLQPPGAKQIVVDLFGTADKAVLEIAVVLGALGLAGGIGVCSRQRPGLGRLGLAGIGILGLFASLRDPLVEPLLALLSGAAGGVLALLLVGTLLRAAPAVASARRWPWRAWPSPAQVWAGCC